MKTLLVTGATGFIGSAFIRYAASQEVPWKIIGFGRNTVQRHRDRLDYPPVRNAMVRGRLELVYGDLLHDISGLCERVTGVVHFGARTFVDHSIRDVQPFVQSNVVGSVNLLEDARRHRVERYIQISTDEVYGPIAPGEFATEDYPIKPSNPYAASKAAADAFVLSYPKTYGMHTTVLRTENNFGPYQHHQKAIPTFCRCAIEGENLPVYGDGLHSRQWLFVTDLCRAIGLLLESDIDPGEVWHVAAKQETTNLDLAGKVIQFLGATERAQIELVDDHDIRPGHDRRYAISSEKITNKLGWHPEVPFEEGLQGVCDWYKTHRRWR